jgi:large subunit ribosomal protein L6
MSRIGKAIVNIPAGVTVTVGADNIVKAKGPQGELSQTIDADMTVNIDGSELTIQRPSDSKSHKAIHGLTRSLVANLVTGVAVGFKKELELVGVGYKAANTGNILDLALGYSHNIIFEIPKEVKLNTVTEKGSNPLIVLESCDKQLIGQVAAKIRSLRKPEPYKGKGVKFKGEVIRRKAGKSAGK